MTRVRWAADREEMELLVDEFVTRGFRVESRDESVARLKKKDRGDVEVHLLIAGLTIWWTIGLANALYAIYKQVTAEEVVIRIDDESGEVAEIGGSVETTSGDGTGEIPTDAVATTDTRIAVWISLTLLSLFVAGFVLLAIFAIHTGQVGVDGIAPTVAMLAIAVAFRYTAVYHQFRKPRYQNILIVVFAVGLIGSSALATSYFVDNITISGLQEAVKTDWTWIQAGGFLPEWWVAAILAPAGLLMILGSLVPRDFTPYAKPAKIRMVAVSPVFFGTICAFFGLWAVLFVGISIQRVVVIAPIFEELLKFGIALVIGSTLFDRSLLARIGVAAVVGSLFGLVEHATTYPTEPDSLYLFRTLFHMMTTVLSVSVYTSFESQNLDTFRWLAPVYSMLIHFFYNLFAVVSAVITVILFSTQTEVLTLVYGGVAILIVLGLTVLVLAGHGAIRVLYMPFENVLSDLV